MSRPTWIIENTSYQNDCGAPQRMTYQLIELGYKVINFKRAPFGDMDYSFLEGLERAVFYGSWNVIDDLSIGGMDGAKINPIRILIIL